MKWNGLPVVIIGTSGISKEVKTIIDEINKLNYINQFKVEGFIAEKDEDVGKKILDSKIIASDSQLDNFFLQYKEIGVIIPIGNPKIKKTIFDKLRKYPNVVYPNIISPTAKIMDPTTVRFGMGNIVCSGVVLTNEINIGNFNLINLNCTIGHNVGIKNYCVINPLTSISGGVKIFNEVLCGAGCLIKQGLTIKQSSVIGLGAFVVKDVEANTIMVCKSSEQLIKRY